MKMQEHDMVLCDKETFPLLQRIIMIFLYYSVSLKARSLRLKSSSKWIDREFSVSQEMLFAPSNENEALSPYNSCNCCYYNN